MRGTRLWLILPGKVRLPLEQGRGLHPTWGSPVREAWRGFIGRGVAQQKPAGPNDAAFEVEIGADSPRTAWYT